MEQPIKSQQSEVAPSDTSSYSISIKDSSVGIPYQRFCDIRSKAQLELRFIDLMEQRAHISEILSSYCTSEPPNKCSERYKILYDKMIPSEKILTIIPDAIPDVRKQLTDILGTCERELRHLYNLYLDECINLELNKIREMLV